MIQRIRGVFLRHFYLWIHNPEYFWDAIWQPIVDVLIWGFVGMYVASTSPSLSVFASYFLGAILLWTVFRAGQHEVTFTLMEEAWSRNLQNILMTPVSDDEFFLASVLFGLVKMLIALSIVIALMAVLFGYSIFSMGFALLPLIANLLIMGWAVGMLVNALIIRFGRGLVAFSWAISFIIQPFACVFYPLSALPEWARSVAALIPATWVFEGMREVLSGKELSLGLLALAFGLNLLYLAAARMIFGKVMRTARERGLLTKLEW